MKIKLLLFITTFLFLSNIYLDASEQKPIEIIKNTVNSVCKILNTNVNSIPAVENKYNQRALIWRNIKKFFDFEEISKRTLASNWKAFSDSEKHLFSTVFGTFLGNTYIDKVQNEYKNEKIIFLKEEIFDNNRAIVKTKLNRNNIKIPINYKLIRHKYEGWKIYDVVIEGISLVANYRSQFKTILKKETPTQLIERLNKKIANQKIKK